jgi:hypothetical protein
MSHVLTQSLNPRSSPYPVYSHTLNRDSMVGDDGGRGGGNTGMPNTIPDFNLKFWAKQKATCTVSSQRNVTIHYQHTQRATTSFRRI